MAAAWDTGLRGPGRPPEFGRPDDPAPEAAAQTAEGAADGGPALADAAAAEAAANAAAEAAAAKDRQRRRRRLFLAAGGALLAAGIALAVLLLSGGGPPEPPGPDPDALYAAHLGDLHAWVQGSDAVKPPPRPAFLTQMRLAGGRAQILAQAVEDFNQGSFGAALDGFGRAGGDLPPDPNLISLQAATHLRLLNYGQAKEFYLRALDMRGPGELAAAADRLGLALCLFHEPDPDGSLREASLAWNLRKERLGPAHPETLAALNVMATSLLALSRTAVAGDILLEAVNRALDEGRKLDDPSLVDSLSIMALAFEAQGRLDELTALFGSRLEAAAPDPSAPSASADPPDPSAPSAPAAAEGGPRAGAGPAAPAPSAPADPSAASAQAAPAAPAGPSGPSATAAPSAPAAPDDLWMEPAPPAKIPLDLGAARQALAELAAQRPESAVLPVLALGIVDELVPRSGPPCSGPIPPDRYRELMALCEILALGYAREGSPAETVRILAGLSAQPPPAADEAEIRPTRMRIEETLAALQTLAGDRPGAEASLRRELAMVDYRGPEAIDQIAKISLRLADNLLAQGRQPIEAELELMAGLTRMEGLARRAEIDKRPWAALLHLRLGLLLRTMSRASDSRDFLRRAERAVAAGRAAHPEASSWYDGLGNLIGQASRAGASVAAKIDLTPLYALEPPATRPAREPADPQIMRLELSALKLLGRTADFRPMIESAMAWAASTSGRGGQLHRRYQSLFLKYLEESGDVESLLAALDDLAENHGLPPGREAVALKTSALRYRARILADNGRLSEAAGALVDARNLLIDQPGFEDRLREVEADLQRMDAGAARP
jgi:tetratricopeptide (TPR) repeat protein